MARLPRRPNTRPRTTSRPRTSCGTTPTRPREDRARRPRAPARDGRSKPSAPTPTPWTSGSGASPSASPPYAPPSTAPQGGTSCAPAPRAGGARWTRRPRTSSPGSRRSSQTSTSSSDRYSRNSDISGEADPAKHPTTTTGGYTHSTDHRVGGAWASPPRPRSRSRRRGTRSVGSHQSRRRERPRSPSLRTQPPTPCGPRRNQASTTYSGCPTTKVTIVIRSEPRTR